MEIEGKVIAVLPEQGGECRMVRQSFAVTVYILSKKHDFFSLT